jgi:hypothetical protein
MQETALWLSLFVPSFSLRPTISLRPARSLFWGKTSKSLASSPLRRPLLATVQVDLLSLLILVVVPRDYAPHNPDSTGRHLL